MRCVHLKLFIYPFPSRVILPLPFTEENFVQIFVSNTPSISFSVPPPPRPDIRKQIVKISPGRKNTTMIPRKQPGTCLLCRKGMSKKVALMHGKNCLSSSGWPVGEVPSFIIRVEDRHNPSFWLMILARHDAQFSELDKLLRDVWMNSENEPSAFTIGKETYLESEEGLEIPLADHLKQGSLWYYKYDPDAPTALKLRVVGTTPVMPPESPLCLISRNQRAFHPCAVCGDDAEFAASKTGDDRTSEYFCPNCLVHLSEVYVQIVENTPMVSGWSTLDNLTETVAWYPPGWNADELVSPDQLEFMTACEGHDVYEDEDDDGWILEEVVDGDDEWRHECPVDDGGLANAISALTADIGEDTMKFLDEEKVSYEMDAAVFSGEIVIGFCTLLYGPHGKTIKDWDGPLMRMCLLDVFAQSPTIPDEWLENTVPVLCRFLTWMGNRGRLGNAAELIAALQETEPLFREIALSHRDTDGSFVSLMEQAMADGTEEDVFDGVCREIVEILSPKLPEEWKSEDYPTIIENIFGRNIETLREYSIHYQTILNRCKDFFTQLDDNESIAERCKQIVAELAAHPDEPLWHGDDLLWSAAIVYVACGEERMIGQAADGSPLALKISEYFSLELSSIQNIVTVLKKRLAECPDTELLFSI